MKTFEKTSHKAYATQYFEWTYRASPSELSFDQNSLDLWHISKLIIRLSRPNYYSHKYQLDYRCKLKSTKCFANCIESSFLITNTSVFPA